MNPRTIANPYAKEKFNQRASPLTQSVPPSLWYRFSLNAATRKKAVPKPPPSRQTTAKDEVGKINGYAEDIQSQEVLPQELYSD